MKDLSENYRCQKCGTTIVERNITNMSFWHEGDRVFECPKCVSIYWYSTRFKIWHKWVKHSYSYSGDWVKTEPLVPIFVFR